MCLEEIRGVLEVVLPGAWGRNGSFGGKECLRRARGWRKLCKFTIK